jgi:glycosyltransferase involved in cell wall biosynthesis
LPALYDSLCLQSDLNFEWLIVDDGSTDTTSMLIQEWMDESPFSIKYALQENGGKHTALNRGINLAVGELFLIIDSDDTCTSDTVEVFKSEWDSIPKNDKNKYSTITALCLDAKGNVIGNKFDKDRVDVESPEQQFILRKQGERFGVNVTSILKDNLFPTFPGERFLPEGVIWNRLSSKYSARFINSPLRIFIMRKDGLSNNILKIRVNSPEGTKLNYFEQLELKLPYIMKLKVYMNYYRFSFHSPNKIICKFNFFSLISLPLAYLIYIYDLYKLKRLAD